MGGRREDERVILGFDTSLVKHLEGDSLPRESLPDLSHGVELVDCFVGDDGHALGMHVGQVHADFLGDAWAEADGGGGHFEGIFL